MSAAAPQRFVVEVFDYEAWSVIVEAENPTEAIKKAQGMYFDGLGTMEHFTLSHDDFGWKAKRLVPEVSR